MVSRAFSPNRLFVTTAGRVVPVRLDENAAVGGVIASAVRMVSAACAGPIETTTTNALVLPTVCNKAFAHKPTGSPRPRPKE
jgi:hypothetical protein